MFARDLFSWDAAIRLSEMRIQVVFNNTPVLVPCGDGKLTVAELIQKAIVRFKKVVNKVCTRVSRNNGSSTFR